jgi:multiple sugar transport system substrate-binding protein
VTHIQTDLFRKNQSAIQIFAAGTPEGIFCSNHDFAQTIKDVWENFYPSARTSIYTVSPVFTMPESSYTKYELNYRQLGQASAKFLVSNQDEPSTGHHTVLHNTGFRTWSSTVPSHHSSRKSSPGSRLRLLTLESPAAEAMRTLSLIYSHTTGVEVDVSVFPYEDIHGVFDSMETSSAYDVVRLDVTWLSWYAGRILRPLAGIDPTITDILGTFVDGIERKYSFVGDTLYALPESPSNQLLFYRKDLLESTVLRRLYHEEYKSRLAPPRDFTEYNRIARFFTKSLSPQSPVDHGSTVTLGSAGVSATEFLTRYLSYTDSLFSPSGHIMLTSPLALKALTDLVELKQYSKAEPCDWWTNAAQEFAEGNVAMTILYSNFASGILHKESRVINRIGYAVVPGSNSIIGGGTLGVSRFSKQPELALSFIRWLCSEPISSALSLLGAFRPAGSPLTTTRSWIPTPGWIFQENASPVPITSGLPSMTTDPLMNTVSWAFWAQRSRLHTRHFKSSGSPAERTGSVRSHRVRASWIFTLLSRISQFRSQAGQGQNEARFHCRFREA